MLHATQELEIGWLIKTTLMGETREGYAPSCGGLGVPPRFHSWVGGNKHPWGWAYAISHTAALK